MTTEQISSTELPRDYPEGLIRWAGYREGGVKKPFRAGSGRPTGSAIKTPLGRRIEAWGQSLVDGTAAVPTVILLVGGPGNGKTDAVEELVHTLDRSFGFDGKLVELFVSAYSVPEGHLPPRTVSADLAKIKASDSPVSARQLSVVQDGTEIDPAQPEVPPDLLLLRDLTNLLHSNSDTVFVCCVNRGILANAATRAHEDESHAEVRALIDEITRAATTAPGAPNCWPLSGHSSIAVWPMDVESILVESTDGAATSPARQILTSATNPARWPIDCPAGPLCPFCTNRKLLDGSGDALLRVLRNYEIASGKRWSFRDLFSLFAHLLVGDYDELMINGRPCTPCEWAAQQASLLDSSSARTADAKARAPYELVGRLYFNRLFPLWPSLDAAEFARIAPALKGSANNEGLGYAADFIKYLRWSNRNQQSNTADSIPNRIRGELSALLDPALAEGSATFFLTKGHTCTGRDLEDRFSLSVEEGLAFVRRSLSKLERDLLGRLSMADTALGGDELPRTHAHLAQRLQAVIRQYACRLVKRSIGVRCGLTRYSTELSAYDECLSEPSRLLSVRKALGQLLHDDRNQLKVSMVTTFGQPLPRTGRQVNLLADKVQIISAPRSRTEARPPDTLPYVRVGARDVAITFEIFHALDRLHSKKLHQASLPEEVTALIDSIRASAGGMIARDWYRLEDGGYIVAGSNLLRLEFTNGDFQVVEAPNA